MILENIHRGRYVSNITLTDDQHFRFTSMEDISLGKVFVMSCPIQDFHNRSWKYTTEQKKLRIIKPVELRLTVLSKTTTFTYSPTQETTTTTTGLT